MDDVTMACVVHVLAIVIILHGLNLTSGRLLQVRQVNDWLPEDSVVTGIYLLLALNGHSAASGFSPSIRTSISPMVKPMASRLKSRFSSVSLP